MMTIIQLETKIAGSVQHCFDLSRDVGTHIQSAGKTKERAIAGRTSGLCELGDRITWEARHFGIRQRLSIEITKMEAPHFFEDRMTKGAFKSMRHEHHFEATQGGTLMRDKFEYEVPFGLVGRIFDRLVLKAYMTRFLRVRNLCIKEVAEAGSKME
jgi:ligand-binding SRPBCC domain-containing protein